MHKKKQNKTKPNARSTSTRFCCGASVANEQEHNDALRRMYRKGSNSHIHQILKIPLHLTGAHCGGFLPECIAPRTTRGYHTLKFWSRSLPAGVACLRSYVRLRVLNVCISPHFGKTWSNRHRGSEELKPSKFIDVEEKILFRVKSHNCYTVKTD